MPDRARTQNGPRYPTKSRRGRNYREDTIPVNDLTTTRAADKLGNGDTWTVTGEHGRIEFDLYGEHGRIYDADGDCLDAFGDALSARIAEYAALDDDDAVFLVLASEYADQFGALTATPR